MAKSKSKKQIYVLSRFGSITSDDVVIIRCKNKTELQAKLEAAGYKIGVIKFRGMEALVDNKKEGGIWRIVNATTLGNVL